jgi:hypothetical protein
VQLWRCRQGRILCDGAPAGEQDEENQQAGGPEAVHPEGSVVE